jgi:outer membrane lipoprotein
MRTVFQGATILFTLVCLCACGGLMRRDTETAESAASDFRTLAQDPVAAAGTYAVLGGEILEIGREGEGSVLVVLHKPLTAGKRSKAASNGYDRFGVRYPEPLDPHLFHRGQRVTIGGRVRGGETQPTGGAGEPLLWLDGQEIHLWEQPNRSLMARLCNQRKWIPWWYDPYYGERPWWW